MEIVDVQQTALWDVQYYSRAPRHSQVIVDRRNHQKKFAKLRKHPRNKKKKKWKIQIDEKYESQQEIRGGNHTLGFSTLIFPPNTKRRQLGSNQTTEKHLVPVSSRATDFVVFFLSIDNLPHMHTYLSQQLSNKKECRSVSSFRAHNYTRVYVPTRHTHVIQ